MYRYIVGVICSLLLGFVAVSGGVSAAGNTGETIKSEFAPCVIAGRNLTEECEGPPWGERCDDYHCGSGTILGYLDGGWSGGSLDLVVHSEGPVEVWFTWIDSTSDDFLGTVQYSIPEGDYTLHFEDILLEIFDAPAGVHKGAIRYDWRSCGDSFIYVNSWAERNDPYNPRKDGQRAAFNNRVLCPDLEIAWDGVCVPAELAVAGCYEVEVPPNTQFIRSQFVSTSRTEWQIVSVDGFLVYVPPLMMDLPQLAAYNFWPIGDFIQVCIGKENPWSGGFDVSDACVIANFESVESATKRRISIPPHPWLDFD